MISLGDKVGPRWFVTQGPAEQAAGVTFELRDAQGRIATGQILFAGPLEARAIETLQAELAKAPRRAPLLLPNEIFGNKASWPVGVYLEAPPNPFTALLGAMQTGGVEARRVETLRTLQRWFGSLARNLDRLHQQGLVHGAIDASRLHLVPSDDGETLAASGFGIGLAAHLAGRRGPLTLRDDLCAALGAMVEALDKTRSTPDPAALPKWELLKRCMRGGEHIALESGRTLAQAFEALHAPPATRKVDTPHKTSGGVTPGAGMPAGRPPPERLATPARGLPAAPQEPLQAAVPRGAFQAPPPPQELSPHTRTRRIAMLSVGGLVAIAAMIAGALALNQPSTAPEGPAPAPRAVHRALASRCQREPTRAALAAPPQRLALGCVTGDAPSVAVFSQAASALSMVTRPTTLGADFQRSVVNISDDAAELGTSYTDDGVWVSWRPQRGHAFVVARVTPTLERVVQETPGWSPDDFTGAHLLRASAAQSWVASTLGVGADRYVVIAQLDATPDSPAPFTLFVLRRGTLLSSAAGDPATLVVATPEAEGTRVEALTVPLRALSGIAESPIPRAALGPDDRDAGPRNADDGGLAPAPTQWVRRLPPATAISRGNLLVPAHSLAAAPTALADPSGLTRVLLVEAREGAEPPRGQLRLVTFRGQGAAESLVIDELPASARAVALTDPGDGLALLAEVNGRLEALEVSEASSVTVRHGPPLAGPLAAVRCGDATFFAHSAPGADASLQLLRLPCGLNP
ncbi:MAG: hypothetical protein JNK72_19895 [Myxococcales bacterium]|nr:hypothetical protein [Myxococcales bacterium]